MTSLVLSIVLLVLFLVVVAVWKAKFASSMADSYSSAKPLTDPEQTLFWRLKEAMPECIVLSQVTFSRFLKPKGAMSRSQHQILFNRISQKSIDFLVCLPDFTVVAALELDDASHSPARDARRDAILTAAGIPVVRVHVKDMPSVENLRAAFIQ